MARLSRLGLGAFAGTLGLVSTVAVTSDEGQSVLNGGYQLLEADECGASLEDIDEVNVNKTSSGAYAVLETSLGFAQLTQACLDDLKVGQYSGGDYVMVQPVQDEVGRLKLVVRID